MSEPVASSPVTSSAVLALKTAGEEGKVRRARQIASLLRDFETSRVCELESLISFYFCKSGSCVHVPTPCRDRLEEPCSVSIYILYSYCILFSTLSKRACFWSFQNAVRGVAVVMSELLCRLSPMWNTYFVLGI